MRLSIYHRAILEGDGRCRASAVVGLAFQLVWLQILLISPIEAFNPAQWRPIRPNFSSQLHALLSPSSAGRAASTKSSENVNVLVNGAHVRWKQTADAWEMQTAVTAFRQQRNVQGEDHDDISKNTGAVTVELHAQLHFGDAAYYEYFNGDADGKNNGECFQADAVLYELLTDENLLKPLPLANTGRQSNSGDKAVPMRCLIPDAQQRSPIVASPADEATAQQYGWKCQVNMINYAQPNWIHADLTRQEFLQRVNHSKNAPIVQGQQGNQALWQLASMQNSNKKNQQSSRFANSEVVQTATTALLHGPPLPILQSTALSPSTSSSTAKLSRRLFTRLFLPGSTLANLLRASMWLAVPSPELFILLLDWSSLLFVEKTSAINDKWNGKGQVNRLGLSPQSGTLLTCLVEGRWEDVRKLVFGQIIVTGHDHHNNNNNEEQQIDNDLLISQRNDRAMQVLSRQIMAMNTVDDNNNNEYSSSLTKDTTIGRNHQKKSKKIALLYGCRHCPDLTQKQMRAGFQPVQTSWRTAWSVPIRSPSNQAKDDSWYSSVGGMAVLAVLTYLTISGLDWIATWRDVIEDPSNISIDTVAYLIRHVLLYVGISRLLLLDWRPEEV